MALAKEKKGTGFSGIFVIMLLIALILDLISAFLGIAEFFIGGLPLISAFVNGIGAVTIGVWLYFQGKKELKDNLLQRLFARIGLSSVVEAIPVLNFLVPTWTINVLSTLEYRRILYLIMIAGVAITPALLISLYNALQPCASPASTCQGFDESKLAKYEQECNGAPDPLETVISPQGKNYAISIGVPEEDIKVWEVEEVRKMVKEEVAKQWSRLSEAEKHGSTQQQAQRAILSYMHHEGDIPKFKMEGGQIVPLHTQDTFPPMSITKWKYEGCKNKQYAAAWDIRYNIYLGVKEIFNIFKSNAISGEGEERWKKAIAYNFLPACPDCYWTGECPWKPILEPICRHQVSIQEWNAPYNNEPAYVCESALTGNNFPVNKNTLSAEARQRIESPPCFKEGYHGNSGSSCPPKDGRFGGSREGGRRHTGIDIAVPYGACPRSIISNPSSAPEQCKVYAVKDGKVIAIYPKFFDDTDAVLVDHGDYVINYGEVSVLVSVGQEVKAGQHIANIIANTGAGSAMLHFELYKAGTRSNLHWYGNDDQKPDALLDPHPFLRELLHK